MRKLIPAPYFHLLARGRCGPMMSEALACHGEAEIPGPMHNPVILSWALEAADAGAGGWLAGFYTEDETPWCGLFMAVCAARAGFPVSPHCLAARSWAGWGEAAATPGIGDVLVFWRGTPDGTAGHVGLYAGEDADCFHVLGGNQGDEVSFMRLPRTRLIAARRGPGEPQRKAVMMAADGPVSRNEA